MADTRSGNFGNENCSDCGSKGCNFQHWGPLVPPGKVLTLCSECWDKRVDYYETHNKPLEIKDGT